MNKKEHWLQIYLANSSQKQMTQQKPRERILSINGHTKKEKNN